MNYYMRVHRLLLVIVLTYAYHFQASAQTQQFYDEAKTGDGKIRELYRPIEDSIFSPPTSQGFDIYSRQAFEKDNALHPIPRILSWQEATELSQGVTQRAKAEL